MAKTGGPLQDYLKPKDIVVPDEIKCYKCKENSGFKRSTLYCLKPGRELKCKKCKEIFLKHI